MNSISVIPYQSTWPLDFAAHLQFRLPQIQPLVARIDHIGSTSVPGLAAKDIIDIQIAVPSFSQDIVDRMLQLGYHYHPHLQDNMPAKANPAQWQKQTFTEPPDTRRINLHVRRLHAPNMRQALLFRDYLRAHPASVTAYSSLKQRLADRHPDDRDFYYAIKDPVFEIFWEAAQVK